MCTGPALADALRRNVVMVGKVRGKEGGRDWGRGRVKSV